MFLGYSILGANSFNNNALPARKSFSGIRLLNEGIADELHVHNTEIEDATLLALGTEESFGTDSVLLAHMSGSLSAGDYTGLDTPIYKYLIYKRKIGDTKYELFAEILQESGITSLYDYSCKNNRSYEYFCIPCDTFGNIGTGTINTIKLNFYGWFLSSISNDQIYKFDLNLESSNVQNVLNITIQNSNHRFPKVVQNRQNYIQGSLSTIPYSKNGEEYVFDIDVLEEIRKFLCDGEAKILRNTAGEGMLVRISGNPQIKYYDQIQKGTLCPAVLNFEYCQIGEVL